MSRQVGSGPSHPDGDGPDAVAAAFAAHLDELHRTLDSKEQAIVEQLVLRSVDPVTRRQVSGTPPFSDDELAFLADLDGADAGDPTSGETLSGVATGHVGLIVKATRLCNLRCGYCYDWRAGPDQTMTFGTLSRLVRAALVDPGHGRVGFAWHGGEPTVLPLAFYERALWLQARYRRPGQLVSNSIMTNATRLDDDWVDFLATNRFSVGVSLDGPPEVHDVQRRDVKGRPTFERVLAGIDRLRGRGVDVGVVMVVDRDTIRRGAPALLAFLVSLGIRSVGLNFVMPPASADPAVPLADGHYVRPADKSRFLIDLYDAWVAHGDPAISIRELDQARTRVAGEVARACTHRGSCLGELFVLDPNGDVSHCSYFGGDGRYRWGNVEDHSFAQIRRSLNLRDAQQRRAADLAGLRSCPDFDTCLGGCPHELYAARRHDPSHREGCCGMAPLLAHLREHPADPAPGKPAGAVPVRLVPVH